MKVVMKGLGSIAATYKAAPKLTKQEARQTLNLIVESVATTSQKLVPVYLYEPGKPKRRGGTLKGSIKKILRETPNSVEGIITYGDAAADYAVYVHENMNPNIKYSTPGTGPKYLERPTLAMAEVLPQRMNFYMARVLKARGDG